MSLDLWPFHHLTDKGVARWFCLHRRLAEAAAMAASPILARGTRAGWVRRGERLARAMEAYARAWRVPERFSPESIAGNECGLFALVATVERAKAEVTAPPRRPAVAPAGTPRARCGCAHTEALS